MGNQFRKVAVLVSLKTFLFLFNIPFWITGVLLLLMGIITEFKIAYIELSHEYLETVNYVVIGIACLVILVGSVAFSIIIKGQPVLLYIYGGFLACTFMMNAGLGAAAACYRDTFPKSLYDGLTRTITNNDPQKANFDFVQKHLHCCGVSNYTDWIRLSPQKVIPISCCIDPDDCITANYSDVFQQLFFVFGQTYPLRAMMAGFTGCYAVINEYLEQHYDRLLTMSMIMFLVLPLVGTFLSCYLASYIKKSKYDMVN